MAVHNTVMFTVVVVFLQLNSILMMFLILFSKGQAYVPFL
jgi:hypothetical protein